MLLRHTTTLLFVVFLSAVTYAADPVVEPTGMWSGKIRDASLQRLAPPFWLHCRCQDVEAALDPMATW